jgi:hypothetical protein
MMQRYLDAERALLEGKEVSFGERRLRMEDLAEIRAGRQEWEARVRAESGAGGGQVFGGRGYSLANFTGAR